MYTLYIKEWNNGKYFTRFFSGARLVELSAIWGITREQFHFNFPYFPVPTLIFLLLEILYRHSYISIHISLNIYLESFKILENSLHVF